MANERETQLQSLAMELIGAEAIAKAIEQLFARLTEKQWQSLADVFFERAMQFLKTDHHRLAEVIAGGFGRRADLDQAFVDRLSRIVDERLPGQVEAAAKQALDWAQRAANDALQMAIAERVRKAIDEALRRR